MLNYKFAAPYSVFDQILIDVDVILHLFALVLTWLNGLSFIEFGTLNSDLQALQGFDASTIPEYVRILETLRKIRTGLYWKLWVMFKA